MCGRVVEEQEGLNNEDCYVSEWLTCSIGEGEKQAEPLKELFGYLEMVCGNFFNLYTSYMLSFGIF